MRAYVASHLKDMNRQVVFRLITERGSTSKAEISKLTGISTPTVIKIVSFLSEKGLVFDAGEGESAAGRKPQMLSINKNSLFSAAFFLEGEFLSLGIVDVAGEVRFKKTLSCEPRLDAMLHRISSGLVDGLFADANIDIQRMTGIGIALPCIYDPHTQRILSAPLIGIDQPTSIKQELEELESRYGVGVLVENDTNCQCLGQFALSKMQPDSDLLFVSVGTGLGAGVILDGKLRRGASLMCGEIGYMSFFDDYEIGTSEAGWLESKVSYRSLSENFGISKDTDLSLLPRGTLEAAIEYVAIHLALCVSNITMLLDCPNVRMGGVVVDIFKDELIEAVNAKLARLCVNNTRVKKQHNEDIGLIGLSSLIIQERIESILTE